MPRAKSKTEPVSEDSLNHVPDAPESLGEEGHRRWQQFCQMLIERKQLSSSCFASLEQLCKLFDHIDEIDKVLDEDGCVFTAYRKLGQDDIAEVPQAHPMVRERLNYMNLLRGYLNDFGFVPRSTTVPKPLPTIGGGIASRKMLKGALSQSPFDN